MRFFRGKCPAWLCAVVAALALPAYAQYPGHVDTTQQQSGTHLRATAVLEYTGSLQDSKATRLVPIAIWDGTQYQPGGLYLAEPAPLAVLPRTQYELESEGRPKGLFTVKDAEDLGGLWIGVGHYQAPAPPRARVAPARRGHTYRVQEVDPDKPHFAHVPADDSAQSSAGASGQSAPPVDPNRPVLHERPNSDSGNSASSSQPDIDPDRPTFHRSSPASTPAAEASVTASDVAIDPNRPHLEYTPPVDQEKLDQPDALAGSPPDMEQIVGISDNHPADTESFAYTYSWANPSDAATMKADLEALAQQALATPPPPRPAKTTKSSAVRRKSHRAAAPILPALVDEQFHVYSLSFGGGATMVLSAQSAGNPVKYVTLIAQPDFYGKPQVLLKQVTGDNMLDVVPRMHLVDAVDTEGNGRADLLFELRGRTWRQFAIYRIAGGTATQAFATQPSAN
jgi:hypothetical protein